MKKLVSLILSVLILAAIFAAPACKKQEQEKTQDTDIRIAALKGPTGMGMVKLIGDEYPHYKVSIESSPDALAPRFISGDVDVAAVPINLASTLYNKLNGDVVVLGVATLGVLYILEEGDEIKSFSDLNGKTIHATGQGSTPEYILKYLLEKNSIENYEIEYVAEHAALATMMAAGEAKIGMLPQPNVTAALNQSDKLRIALDLTEEWNKVSDAQLVQGVVIARKDFAEKNKSAIEIFLKDYEASTKFVNENVDAAAKLIAEAEILPQEGLAKKAIPNCNIKFIGGKDMKNAVSGMLKVLFEANPQGIGGKLPADDFYFGA